MYEVAILGLVNGYPYDFPSGLLFDD